jgi:hypothetical protein
VVARLNTLPLLLLSDLKKNRLGGRRGGEGGGGGGLSSGRGNSQKELNKNHRAS